MSQDQAAQAEPSKTIPVADLNQFVGILTVWHAERCDTVKHLLTIPDGSELQVGDDEEAKTITLTGDSLAAFKLGVEMALMELGELPFVAEMEDEPAPAVQG